MGRQTSILAWAITELKEAEELLEDKKTTDSYLRIFLQGEKSAYSKLIILIEEGTLQRIYK